MQAKEHPSRALPKKTNSFLWDPTPNRGLFKAKERIMNVLKKLGFTLLGIISLLALLCSIAASCVTNNALMEQGFLQYGDTKHFDLSPTAYKSCALSIARYLDGKSDTVPDPRDESNCLFSENEMLHLADVRGIVNGLKGMRFVGGGLALCVLAALWLWGQKKKEAHFLQPVWQGFAWASGLMFTVAAALCIWALVDFEHLFLAFHRLAFANDLWLMNPQTDVMIALMPQEFFMWYGGEMLKSLLPIFGIMLCLIISWLKVGKKETEGAK